jgi:hypothetical protein
MCSDGRILPPLIAFISISSRFGSNDATIEPPDFAPASMCSSSDIGVCNLMRENRLAAPGLLKPSG